MDVQEKKKAALFYVNALHYEGVRRKEIIETLMVEFNMTKTNASYYVDRAAYSQ